MDAETGEAPQSAQVFIEGTTYGRLTDSRGAFEFLVESKRPVIARVNRLGSCEWAREISVGDETSRLEIRLFEGPDVMDGPPTVAIAVPGFFHALEKPISRDELRCRIEESEFVEGRADLSLYPRRQDSESVRRSSP